MHQQIMPVTQLHELILHLLDGPAPHFPLIRYYSHSLLSNLRMQ
jgi:hypothetical protein